MAEVSTNIMLGAAKPYKATVGTSLPTITGTLSSTITWTNWALLPYRDSKVDIELTAETRKVTPAGKKTPIMGFQTAKGATVKITLLEADADAFYLSLPTATKSNETVSDGGYDTAETYFALALETDLMVFHFKRCQMAGAVPISTNDGEETKLEITIDCYALDTETATEQVYKFHERT